MAIPSATWLALTFLLHASRTMPAVPGIPYVWLALSVVLAIGERGILPVTGPAYFVIVYFAAGDRTMTVQVPMGRVPTLSARTGDLFAWLCVAALVMALGIAAVAPGKISARLFHDPSYLVLRRVLQLAVASPAMTAIRDDDDVRSSC